ncbi:TPA: hypothetical protein ACGSTL_001198 [Vibrio parahaemolyticus]|uniref:hypothetical protein n=1 Tax=Vibrio campbellii TaxID=680 RepID=UPI001F0743F5|nr:hypothetical protein [Vibrio campbellii]UMM06619.1 hypothetical protein MKR81_27100 [Vibrio campbellii]
MMKQLFKVADMTGGILEFAAAKAVGIKVDYDNQADCCDQDVLGDAIYAPLKGWKHFGPTLFVEAKQEEEQITSKTIKLKNGETGFAVHISTATDAFCGTGSTLQEAGLRARVLATYGEFVELEAESSWEISPGDHIVTRWGTRGVLSHQQEDGNWMARIDGQMQCVGSGFSFSFVPKPSQSTVASQLV